MKSIRYYCGEEDLKLFVDKIKNLGFKYGSYYTGSVGFKDFFNVPNGKELINETIKKQINLQSLLEDGLITQGEINTKSSDLWKEVTNKGKEIMDDMVEKNPFNPMVIITKSGARGSSNQLSQMLFMKGSVIDISGEFSNIPIVRGHREGLNMNEYFILSFGARKGVADVALKTAEAGYFTRRLVDVAHSCVVYEDDCRTQNFLTMKNIFKKGQLLMSVYDQILTRVSAKDILHPVSVSLIVKKNQLINEDIVQNLRNAEITEIDVRSPVLCGLDRGVCAKCYGGDISQVNQMVNKGEVVGIIAAQSIGEPGTQLTMRSFHSGGVAKFGDQKESIISPFDGELNFEKILLVTNADGENINVARDGKLILKNRYGFILAELEIPYGASIVTQDKQNVLSGDVLASWKLETPIIAEQDGQIELNNLQPGFNCDYITDNISDKKMFIITQNKDSPSITLKNNNGYEISYFLPINTIVQFNDKEKVRAGDKIAYTQQSQVAIDIVGGLQKFINVLENRLPVKMGILSKWNGTVEIHNDKKGKVMLKVIEDDGKEHDVMVGMSEIAVQNNHKITKGDFLTVGTPSLQDVLDSRGINSLIEHFVSELQSIYLEHGIKINSKHLEIILKQMCVKYELLKDYDNFVSGKIIDRVDLNKMNEEFNTTGKPKLDVKLLVSGITTASLESISFLSSASFQETISVLVNSAVKGAVDDVLDIKSCIIFGKPIHGGTGFALDYFKKASDLLKTQEG